MHSVVVLPIDQLLEVREDSAFLIEKFGESAANNYKKIFMFYLDIDI